MSLSVVVLATLGLSGCFDNKREPGSMGDDEPTATIEWVKPLSSEQAIELMPFLAAQPVVIKVHSDLCSECQQLAPVLKKVADAHPTVPVLTLNINKSPECESAKKNYDAIKNALQPMVTPTLIFFEQGGANTAVLTGAPNEDELEKRFIALEGDGVEVPAGMSLPQPNDPNTLFSCDS